MAQKHLSSFLFLAQHLKILGRASAYIYIKGRSNLEAYCSDLNKLYLGYSRHYNRLKKKVQFQAILSHFPGSSVRLLHFIYGIEVPSEFHGDFD